MKRFKKILVYLPHTVVDEYVIHWTSAIVENADSESVDILSSFEGYEHLLTEPNWEKFVKDISDEWLENSELKNMKAEVNFHIHRRPGLKMILESLSSGEYDLVILPKEHCDGISFVERVVRKSSTGVLVVPMHSKPDLSNIMLAVDFADISPLALEWAEAFATIAAGETNLTALHVMRMPDQARAMSVAQPEAIRHSLEQVSKEKLSDFVSKHSNYANEWRQRVVEHPLPAVEILEQAKADDTKLLVIGSHGRHALSSTLLGGQSIDLIRKSEVPLLVVKRKNETLGLIRELLGLNK